RRRVDRLADPGAPGQRRDGSARAGGHVAPAGSRRGRGRLRRDRRARARARAARSVGSRPAADVRGLCARAAAARGGDEHDRAGPGAPALRRLRQEGVVTAGQRVDVAIIGSGSSATLLAMALRRRGRSVALVEAGRHPRFAIGESSTPLANLLLEEIATEYDLPRLAPLAKWSTWR